MHGRSHAPRPELTRASSSQTTAPTQGTLHFVSFGHAGKMYPPPCSTVTGVLYLLSAVPLATQRGTLEMRHQILITPIEDPPKMAILSRPQTRPKTALRRAWNPPSPLLPQQERVHIPTLKLTSFADAFQIAFWLYPDPFWEVWRPPRLLQDTSKSTQF